MLALFGNLDFSEIVLIGVLAVLIFGKRLPSVASETFGQFKKLRRALDDVRRDTGIDKELAKLDTTMRDFASGDAGLGSLVDPLELRTARRYPKKLPAAAQASLPAAEPSPPPRATEAPAPQAPAEEAKREAPPESSPPVGPAA